MQIIQVTTPKPARPSVPKAPSRDAVLKAIMPRKTSLEIVTQVAIDGPTLQATDLDVWGITAAPEDLQPGVYRLIGGVLAHNQATPLQDWPLASNTLGEAQWCAAWDAPAEMAALDAARGTDIMREALCGIHVHSDGDYRVQLTTTDGHRLVRRQLARINPYGPAGEIVMKPRLADMAVLCRGYGAMAFTKYPEHQMLTVGPWTFIAQAFDNIFPNVERVLPDKCRFIDEYNRHELIAAIKALKPFCNKRAPIVSVWRHEAEAVRIEAQDHERELHMAVVVPFNRSLGEYTNPGASQSLDLVMPIGVRPELNDDGIPAEAPEYQFNPAYLIDALEHIAGETVQLRGTNANAAFMLI